MRTSISLTAVMPTLRPMMYNGKNLSFECKNSGVWSSVPEARHLPSPKVCFLPALSAVFRGYTDASAGFIFRLWVIAGGPLIGCTARPGWQRLRFFAARRSRLILI